MTMRNSKVEWTNFEFDGYTNEKTKYFSMNLGERSMDVCVIHKSETDESRRERT